jgi:hypothetical protein
MTKKKKIPGVGEELTEQKTDNYEKDRSLDAWAKIIMKDVEPKESRFIATSGKYLGTIPPTEEEKEKSKKLTKYLNSIESRVGNVDVDAILKKYGITREEYEERFFWHEGELEISKEKRNNQCIQTVTLRLPLCVKQEFCF